MVNLASSKLRNAGKVSRIMSGLVFLKPVETPLPVVMPLPRRKSLLAVRNTRFLLS